MLAKLRSLLSALIALACRLTLILSLVRIAGGVALIGLKMPFVGMVAVGLIAWRRFRRRTISNAYGSATTAGVGQMERGGLLADNGVILGRLFPERPTLREGIGRLLNPTVRSDIAVRSFFAAVFRVPWLGEKLIRTNNH